MIGKMPGPACTWVNRMLACGLPPCGPRFAMGLGLLLLGFFQAESRHSFLILGWFMGTKLSLGTSLATSLKLFLVLINPLCANVVDSAHCFRLLKLLNIGEGSLKLLLNTNQITWHLEWCTLNLEIELDGLNVTYLEGVEIPTQFV